MEYMTKEYVLDTLFDNEKPLIYDMKDEFKSLLKITKRDTNIQKLKKYNKYEAPHDKDSIDCDTCELATFVYNKAFDFLKGVGRPQRQYKKAPFCIRNHKYQLVLKTKEKEAVREYYRGDSMTSFKEIYKHSQKFINNELIQEQIEKLAKNYHTIGNMIPVSTGFNVRRAKNPKLDYNNAFFDFWDLAMISIKEYIDTKNDDPLNKLLKNDKDAVDNCKKWLSHFNNGWKDFVDNNYLQPFVDDSYNVIMFWQDHSFDNYKLPEDEKSFFDFLKFLNGAIISRNILILKKLYEDLSKDLSN